MKKSKSTAAKKIEKQIDNDFLKDLRSVRSASRDELSRPAAAYQRCIIDPRNAVPSPAPTLIGGNSNEVRSLHTKCVGTIKTNATSGFGFILIGDPCLSTGPYEDRIIATISNTSYTLSVTDWNGNAAGVDTLNWAEADYTAAGSISSDLSYQCDGLAVYIKPIGSMQTQNGRVVIVEDPGHENLTNFTFDQLSSYSCARVISGVDASSSDPELVLNWHPRDFTQEVMNTSSMEVRGSNEFGFFEQNSALGSTGVLLNAPMAIAFAGDGSTSYEFEIHACWSVKGRKVKPNRRVLTDSRGMDLIMNTFGDKQESGYHAKPEHVEEAYKAHAAYHAHEIGVERHPENRRTFAEKHPVISELGKVAGMALKTIVPGALALL